MTVASAEKIAAARLAVQQGVSFMRQAEAVSTCSPMPPGLYLSIMATTCFGLELCLKGTILADPTANNDRTHSLVSLWKRIPAITKKEVQRNYAKAFQKLAVPGVAIIDVIPTEQKHLLDQALRNRSVNTPVPVPNPRRFGNIDYVLELGDDSFVRLRYFYEKISFEKCASFIFLPGLLWAALNAIQETFWQKHGNVS